MACFHFLQENDDENDFLPLRTKNADLMMLSLIKKLSSAVMEDEKSTFEKCIQGKLKGEDLIQVVLKNSVEYLMTISPASMFKLFQLCFDLHQSNC